MSACALRQALALSGSGPSLLRKEGSQLDIGQAGGWECVVRACVRITTTYCLANAICKYLLTLFFILFLLTCAHPRTHPAPSPMYVNASHLNLHYQTGKKNEKKKQKNKKTQKCINLKIVQKISTSKLRTETSQRRCDATHTQASCRRLS